ncbi:MAG: SRPBCC family protein [Gaiellaceae bacterium]
MPRYVAERTLLAPVDDVWAFLAEPYNLADWYPGIGGIEADRRGLAPGARWAIRSTDVPAVQPLLGPGMFRRPGAAGVLLVTDVVTGSVLAFQLVQERITAELRIAPAGAAETRVTLTVEAPFAAVRRTYAKDALGRLYDLLQTGAGP